MITSKFFNMGQVVTTRSINDLMAAEQKFSCIRWIKKKAGGYYGRLFIKQYYCI